MLFDGWHTGHCLYPSGKVVLNAGVIMMDFSIDRPAFCVVCPFSPDPPDAAFFYRIIHSLRPFFYTSEKMSYTMGRREYYILALQWEK